MLLFAIISGVSTAIVLASIHVLINKCCPKPQPPDLTDLCKKVEVLQQRITRVFMHSRWIVKVIEQKCPHCIEQNRLKPEPEPGVEDGTKHISSH